MNSYISKQVTPLQQAFGFNMEDLNENQRGRLSPTQAVHMRAAARQMAAITLAALGGVAALTLLTVPLGGTELLIALLALGIPAALALWLTVGAAESAIAAGRVERVSGIAHLGYGLMGYDPPLQAEQYAAVRRWRLGRQSAYMVLVDGREFRLTREQHAALPAGAYLNVFVVPATNKVVSVEIVDSPIPTLEPQEAYEGGTGSYGSTPAAEEGDGDTGGTLRG
jgi:hypothetical protein